MVRRRGYKEALIPIKWDTRIRLRLFRERGLALSGFTSQLEHHFKGGWRPVVRYDTAHGFFHRDFYSTYGKQKKKEKIEIHNLKEAVLFADKDLRKNYEEYIEKFERDEL